MQNSGTETPEEWLSKVLQPSETLRDALIRLSTRRGLRHLGLPPLNALYADGVPGSSIIEVVGPPQCGKTEVLLQAMATVVLPPTVRIGNPTYNALPADSERCARRPEDDLQHVIRIGGHGQVCLWLDCDIKFSLWRALATLDSRIRSCIQRQFFPGSTSVDVDAKVMGRLIEHAFGSMLEYDHFLRRCLDRIYIFRCDSPSATLRRLCSLPQFLQTKLEEKNLVGITVIVDSLSTMFSLCLPQCKTPSTRLIHTIRSLVETNKWIFLVSRTLQSSVLPSYTDVLDGRGMYFGGPERQRERCAADKTVERMWMQLNSSRIVIAKSESGLVCRMWSQEPLDESRCKIRGKTEESGNEWKSPGKRYSRGREEHVSSDLFRIDISESGVQLERMSSTTS